jgi:hypothetical protein
VDDYGSVVLVSSAIIVARASLLVPGLDPRGGQEVDTKSPRGGASYAEMSQ